MHHDTVISSINASPLNRGLKGEDWVSDERNISVVDGADVTLFDFESPGVYQVHFLYESRGRAAIEQAKIAFRHLFEMGAEIIFGLVPAERRDVAWLARQIGGKFAGMRETNCGPCEIYVLPRDIWKRSVQ